METLQKITITYDAAEDRIKMSGLLPDKQTVNIWLTQRLLGLLLKEILAWLSESKSAGSNGEVHVSSVKEMMQEFAQQAAVSTQQPEAPVVATKDARYFFPTGFDYSRNDQAFSITFRANVKVPDSESYKITLEEVVSRRWLQGLYGVYKQAGWPLDIWPEWIVDAVPPSKPIPPIVKH